MAWLVVLAALLLIGFIPIALNVVYDEHGTTVRFVVGPIRATVFPKVTKERRQYASVKTDVTSPAVKQKGGSYKDFLPLLHLILDLLADVRRKICVNNLRFRLILAGGDPCDLAVNYGRAWAAVGNVMPQLERIFILKKRDVEVECDFTADRTTVLFGVDITITVARLLYLGFRHGFRIIKEYSRVMNKRKGGASI